MKKFLTVTLTIALVFALALATTACDDGNDKGKDDQKEEPHVPQPTQKILSFGKITVSSEDQYLSSEWTDLVDSLVSSLESMYAEGDDEDQETFREQYVFGGDGLKIVLVNDLAKNWEVKKGESKGTLYIKTGSIGSISTGSYMSAAYSIMKNEPAISVY